MKSARTITWKAGAATAGLALLLASCGGEDSTGSPPAASAPTPAPSPTPSPTPSAPTTPVPPPATSELPPAPFGITGDTTFALLGWQNRSNGADAPPTFNLAEEKGSLAWSTSLKTYRIDLADLASGKLVYTFGSSRNNLAFSIVRPDGSVALAYVSLIVRSANMGEIYWQTADLVQPFISAQALFGIPVPAGTLPTSGTRTFVTDPVVKSEIEVDFAARKIGGTLTTFYQDAWTEGPVETATLTPADIQPDGTFVAEIAIAGSDRKGELRGRLFGASASELGLFFSASLRDGYGGRTEYQTVLRYDACTTC